MATGPLLSLVGDWDGYLEAMRLKDLPDFERHERTGRPLGDAGFVQMAEKLLGRDDLRKKKPGPKAGS
ncbi:MAG TPA: hypothetical protein ENJ86_06410 [Methylothermaceae bacterium]|nr:hypothetical protein [Methylothermaceae bacterium]